MTLRQAQGDRELLDDLRQGVTPTQHAVLDLVDQFGTDWGASYCFKEQLQIASHNAQCAVLVKNPMTARAFALEAAARLIDAAGRFDPIIVKLDGAA